MVSTTSGRGNKKEKTERGSKTRGAPEEGVPGEGSQIGPKVQTTKSERERKGKGTRVTFSWGNNDENVREGTLSKKRGN